MQHLKTSADNNRRISTLDNGTETITTNWDYIIKTKWDTSKKNVASSTRVGKPYQWILHVTEYGNVMDRHHQQSGSKDTFSRLLRTSEDSRYWNAKTM